MLPTRNITVKTRRNAILESLPSDRSFSMEEVRESIRMSGVLSRAGIQDYVTIHLKSFIEPDGDKYKLKH